MANMHADDATCDEARAAGDIRWAAHVDPDGPLEESIAKVEFLIAHADARLSEASPSQRDELEALRHRVEQLTGLVSAPRPNRIIGLRGLRGLTLADVAAAIGESEQTVGHWETHQEEIPRRQWQPLASLFRVQVPWLLGIEEDVA